jgi:phosphatidylglycerophosphate synthase
LGRIFDPIGDKVAAFVVALFCVFYRGLPWAAFALTTARDLVILVGGLVIFRRTSILPGSADLGRYAALLWGVVLLLYTFDLQPYARFTLWPVVGVYLVAGAHYALRGLGTRFS